MRWRLVQKRLKSVLATHALELGVEALSQFLERVGPRLIS